MNKVILVGRLTKDPEIRGDKTPVTRFSVAVNRPFKNSDGEYDADFPNCVAFGKTAEIIGEHFNKGKWIGITGRLQTGSYVNKNGDTVYTTEVVVDTVEFVGNKNDNINSNSSSKSKKGDDEEYRHRSQQEYMHKEEFEETEADDDYPFS